MIFDNDWTDGIYVATDDESEKDEQSVIDSFSGEYEFLSNFYDCVQNSDIAHLNEEGEAKFIKDTFRTVEHAFQASKTLVRAEQEEIRDVVSAKAAKSLGRRATLRGDWDQKRITIMERLVSDKFYQNFSLRMQLIATEGYKLVEGNTWKDQFWGVTADGIGENHMGKILMKIRDEIIRNQGSFEQQLRGFLRENQLDFVNKWVEIKFR